MQCRAYYYNAFLQSVQYWTYHRHDYRHHCYRYYHHNGYHRCDYHFYDCNHSFNYLLMNRELDLLLSVCGTIDPADWRSHTVRTHKYTYTYSTHSPKMLCHTYTLIDLLTLNDKSILNSFYTLLLLLHVRCSISSLQFYFFTFCLQYLLHMTAFSFSLFFSLVNFLNYSKY